MHIRAIIPNIIVSVITLLLCCGIAELGLRIHHTGDERPILQTEPPYRRISDSGGSRLIPGSDVMFLFESTDHPVRVRINSLGCRGPEIPPVEQDDHRRLLILGDSVAFGYGIAEEHTFSARIDSALSSLPQPWRVVNASVEDIGIVDERMIFETIASKIRPEIVILAFYANDSRPPVGFDGEFLREDPVDRWFRTHPGILSRSYLARFVHFRYRTLATTFRLYNSPLAIRFRWVEPWQTGEWRRDPLAMQSLITAARFDWGAAWFDESWGVVGEELDRIMILCNEIGASLTVCYFPVQIQVEGACGPPYPQEKLASLCTERELTYIDLLPVLRGRERMFIDQCHLTESAHSLVGDIIVSALFESDFPALQPCPAAESKSLALGSERSGT